MPFFFLSCTASLRSSNHRPVASLMLSSHRICGFPCFLCPATCPSIMSHSSDLFALMTWPKNFNQRIVTSSDLLGFTSSKTERFVLFSVQGIHKILLHVHSSAQKHKFFSFPFSALSSSRFHTSLSGILYTVQPIYFN